MHWLTGNNLHLLYVVIRFQYEGYLWGSDEECTVYNIIEYLIKSGDQSPTQPRPIRSTLSMNEEGLAPWVYFHYGRRPTYYACRATAAEMSGWHTARVSINFTRGTQTQFSKVVFYKKVVHIRCIFCCFFFLLSTINDDHLPSLQRL